MLLSECWRSGEQCHSALFICPSICGSVETQPSPMVSESKGYQTSHQHTLWQPFWSTKNAQKWFFVLFNISGHPFQIWVPLPLKKSVSWLQILKGIITLRVTFDKRTSKCLGFVAKSLVPRFSWSVVTLTTGGNPVLWGEKASLCPVFEEGGGYFFFLLGGRLRNSSCRGVASRKAGEGRVLRCGFRAPWPGSRMRRAKGPKIFVSAFFWQLLLAVFDTGTVSQPGMPASYTTRQTNTTRTVGKALRGGRRSPASRAVGWEPVVW